MTMQDFQALGASLDAESQSVGQILACSTIIDPAGFSLTLHYAAPADIGEGYDPRVANHKGVQGLMNAMAACLRDGRIDFEAVMVEAVEKVAGTFAGNVDQLVAPLNLLRGARGLPPLTTPDGEVKEAVDNAISARDAFWQQRMDAMIQDRLKIIAEGAGITMEQLGFKPEKRPGPPAIRNAPNRKRE